jgi:hypothetical protein
MGARYAKLRRTNAMESRPKKINSNMTVEGGLLLGAAEAGVRRRDGGDYDRNALYIWEGVV